MKAILSNDRQECILHQSRPGKHPEPNRKGDPANYKNSANRLNKNSNNSVN
jgi:hypothetical protein